MHYLWCYSSNLWNNPTDATFHRFPFILQSNTLVQNTNTVPKNGKNLGSKIQSGVLYKNQYKNLRPKIQSWVLYKNQYKNLRAKNYQRYRVQSRSIAINQWIKLTHTSKTSRRHGEVRLNVQIIFFCCTRHWYCCSVSQENTIPQSHMTACLPLSLGIYYGNLNLCSCFQCSLALRYFCAFPVQWLAAE